MHRILPFLLLFPVASYAQLFKYTSEGLILVQDSITDNPISKEIFVAFENDTLPMANYDQRYQQPMLYNGEMILAETKDGWGCITKTGKILIPFRHRYRIELFRKNTLYGIYEDNKQGYSVFNVYDFSNKLIKKFNYQYASYKGFHVVGDPDSYLIGVINDNMDVVLPYQYKVTDDRYYYQKMSEEYMLLQDSGGFQGIISYTGQIKIPFEYYDIEFPKSKEEVGTIKKSTGNTNGWITNVGLIDHDMNFVIPCEYSEIIHARKDIKYPVCAKKNWDVSWTVFDSLIKPIPNLQLDGIDPEFTYYPPISIVSSQGKTGVFNFGIGKFEIPCKYDSIYNFKIAELSFANRYVGHMGNTFEVLNDSLRLINSFQADSIFTQRFNPSLILQKGNSFFLYSLLFNSFSATYDVVTFSHSYIQTPHTYLVKQNNKVGWLNDKFNVFIPIEYDAGCRISFNVKDGKSVKTYNLLKDKKILYFNDEGELIDQKDWNGTEDYCH